MKTKQISWIFYLLLSVMPAWAGLKVASLHPLMADLARQVGGDRVEVVELMTAKDNAHHFQPQAADLRRADGAAIYLASGKGLETYLPKLQQTLAGKAQVLEVGRLVPSILLSKNDALYVCCPDHAAGSVDPHWWHSIYNMRKATQILAGEFAKADPTNAAQYKANAAAYLARLDQLNKWAKQQVALIPRANRKLATGHAAFGYFCKEFGFKSIPLQGLNKDQAPTPEYLRVVTESIQQQQVRAIFPEVGANPKTLQALSKATGVKIGKALSADGMSASYEEFVKSNVSRVVEALTQAP